MPRTKRTKRTRPTNQSESDKNKLDPNIVIKQEPEDPLPDNMEFETDTNVNPVEAKCLLPVDNLAAVYSLKQLAKLGDEMCKKERKLLEQRKQKFISAINVIKMKIPVDIRNVPIADLPQTQGLKPSDSNDLLSVSQQTGNNEVAIHGVDQTNKTLSNDLRKECIIGNDTVALSSMNKFKTPDIGLPKSRIGTITPKVGPNSPITVLRRPKLGEVVVSMKGSPVMLNAAREDAPTLNIPMSNGTVMSILPERGLRTAHLPQEIGPETRDHLKAIMENLQDLIAVSETPRH